MDQEETQTIRISKKKHQTLAFFCKFKGKTIKDYIHDKLDQDPELKKFKKRVNDLMFKYEDEGE